MIRSGVILFTALLALTACGGDSGSGPASGRQVALVGSWQFVSTNIFELMADRLRPFLMSLETPGQDVEASIATIINDFQLDRQYFDPDEILTFEADGSWRDSKGDAGQWHALQDMLLRSGVSGTSIEVSYSFVVQSDSLTLTMSRDEVLRLLDATADVDGSLVGLFGVLFQPQDLFIYKLGRLD
jgi:hypothetical protein